jgi:hypothetical protein
VITGPQTADPDERLLDPSVSAASFLAGSEVLAGLARGEQARVSVDVLGCDEPARVSLRPFRAPGRAV